MPLGLKMSQEVLDNLVGILTLMLIACFLHTQVGLLPQEASVMAMERHRPFCLALPFLSFPFLSSPLLSSPLLSFPFLSFPFLSFPTQPKACCLVLLIAHVLCAVCMVGQTRPQLACLRMQACAATTK